MNPREDDLPYRAPFVPVMAAPVSKVDESNYDTLRDCADDLRFQLESLHDFDAFSIGSNLLPKERAELLLHEVEVNQRVAEIIKPVYERLQGAVDMINGNHRST